MPSKKKKYNARFPAGRIKKIMQTDDEVGKVAQAVPVIISKTLELFVQSLLTKTMQITSAKNAKTLSPSHMKQCILSESRFDFLKDLVKGLPDVSGPDEEVPTPPLTPAPININVPNTATSVISPSDIGFQKQSGLSNISIEHKSSKDNGAPEFSNLSADNETVKTASASELTNLSGVNETTKTTSEPQVSNLSAVNKTTEAASPQVPKFQISVPTPFQISQLNFYTEVNPVNLSTNPPAVNANNQPTSNFAHTANIDEDYDT